MAANGKKSVTLVTKTRKRKRVASANRANTSMVVVPAAGSAIVRRGVNPPRVSTRGMSTIVRNTELMAVVTTAALGAVSNNREQLVPSNMPWLNGLARNYNKFRWLFLKVLYMPKVPTTTTGQMAMGFGYDVNDGQPATMEQAQQVFNSVSSPVWAGFEGSSDMNRYTVARSSGAVSLLLDVQRLGGPTGDAFYRYGTAATLGVLTAWEQNIYVPAFVDVTTAGGLAVTVGDLFVEYEIELIEPTVLTLNN